MYFLCGSHLATSRRNSTENYSLRFVPTFKRSCRRRNASSSSSIGCCYYCVADVIVVAAAAGAAAVAAVRFVDGRCACPPPAWLADANCPSRRAVEILRMRKVATKKYRLDAQPQPQPGADGRSEDQADPQ